MIFWTFLRPDPLVVLGGTDPHAERVRPMRQLRASYGVIRGSPGAVLGLASMAAQPGGDGRRDDDDAAAHEGPRARRPVGGGDRRAHLRHVRAGARSSGAIVRRVGAVRAIEVGAVVLGAGTVAAVVAGYVPALIFVGLFLLGLGWSLGLIAGTTLLTASVPLEARVEAQGTGDLTLSLCGAVGRVRIGLRQAVSRLPRARQPRHRGRRRPARVRVADARAAAQGRAATGGVSELLAGDEHAGAAGVLRVFHRRLRRGEQLDRIDEPDLVREADADRHLDRLTVDVDGL